MMKRRGSVVVALAGLLQLTCHQAILVAPPGSSMSLFANPTFIPSNGGVSVISALVYEPAGTPVPDGTVVQFFTTLGRIQEQGKTNDGVARVNLVSDSRSGLATVTAVSGGNAPAPQATASAAGSTAAEGARALSGSATQAAESVEVVIGNANAAAVFVSAEPVRLTNSRTSQIAARVVDVDGNFVANVPVFFSVEGSPANNEFMESGGSVRFTDTNGIARDVLRTRAGFDVASYTVTVRATTSNGAGSNAVSGTTEVRIN